MSSFWNWGPHHHSGLPITTALADTSAYGGTHDPETGRDVRYHSPGQRRSYLARHPEMAGKLPPVADPNRIPAWDDCSTIDGAPASLQRKYERIAEQAALLKDPIASVQRRLPTKPVAKPEPAISLYRSSIHECGHVLACFVFDVPVARMTLIKDGDRLGHIKHADLPDSEAHLSILLGGRAAEIVEFGNERTTGCETDMQDARAMAKRLAGDGAEGLIEKMLARTVDMLRGERDAVRYLAYELVRRRQIDFDDIDLAIDRAFTRAQATVAKAVPAKARVSRTYNMHNPADLAAWNAKQGRAPDADPIGYAPGYISRVNK